MRPPESPRREGKRREDEDYFVVEVNSNVLYKGLKRSTKDRTIIIEGSKFISFLVTCC